MRIKVIPFIFILTFSANCLPCFAVLFDTVGPSGGRYQDLLDLLHDEQNQLNVLEKYIVGDIQKEIQKLKNETEFLRNESKILEEQYTVLRVSISGLNNSTAAMKDGEILTGQVEIANQETGRKIQVTGDRITQVYTDFYRQQVELLSNVTALKQAVTGNYDQFLIQTCGGFYLRNQGRIVFPSLQQSRGFQDLSQFLKDAVLRCERSGLYLVVSSLTSVESEATFSIVKNNSTVLAQTQIVPQHDYLDGMIHTGTTSALVYLNTGETITIMSDKYMPLYGEKSCASLVLLD